jgi:hypothetical protein
MIRVLDSIVIASAYLALSSRASDEFFAWAFFIISICAWIETFLRARGHFNADYRLKTAFEELNAAARLYRKRDEKAEKKVAKP